MVKMRQKYFPTIFSAEQTLEIERGIRAKLFPGRFVRIQSKKHCADKLFVVRNRHQETQRVKAREKKKKKKREEAEDAEAEGRRWSRERKRTKEVLLNDGCENRRNHNQVHRIFTPRRCAIHRGVMEFLQR